MNCGKNSFPIVFVRHGESEANIYLHNNDEDADNKINKLGDPELSKLGFMQSEETCKSIMKHLIESGSPKVTILVSKFTRARQTSEYFIDNYVGEMNVVYTPDLLEYTPLKKQLSQLHLDSGLYHDNTWDDFKNRVVTFCDKYVTQVPTEPIIVFGHSLFFSCLMSYISSHKKFIPDKHELTFRFPNCSISSVCWDLDRERWVIDFVASIAHLSSNIVTGTHVPFGNKI